MRLQVPPASFYPGSDFFKGYGIPLRVIHVEPSPPFPPHRHDFTELVVVFGGGGRHVVDGAEYRIGSGDVFLIPRGSTHEYADPEDLCYINVIYDEAALLGDSLRPAGGEGLPRPFATGEPRSPLSFKLSVFGAREIVGIINRIDQELFQKGEGYAFMAKAHFLQLWGALSRRYAARRYGEREGESSASRIERIVDFLRQNSGVSVSVEDMAKEAGTCVRNFHRAFKKATGDSPLAYVNRLRIEKACELLRDTDKTVTQIAFLIGYDDGNYFARQFRHFMGTTPSRYRSG